MNSTLSIAQIGIDFFLADNIAYNSRKNLLEYDLIIFDFNCIGQSLSERETHEVNTLFQLFSEFVNHKKIPIVAFPPRINSIAVYSPMTRSQMIKNWSSFLGIEDFKLEFINGSKISVLKNSPFVDFFSPIKDKISYYSIVNIPNAVCLLETHHSRKPVSVLTEHFLFIPTFTYPDNEFKAKCLELLYKCLVKHRDKTEFADLPSWSENYKTSFEINIQNKIEEIKAEIEEKNTQLEINKSTLSQYKNTKRLFTSSGNELEQIVKQSFLDIGFEELLTGDKREDLILKYNELVFIFEIKGISKSASEKHSAQLEKWAATYLSTFETKAKPVLVVNAFKETPLKERTELAFPAQMISYAEARGHCLISTVQLFNMYHIFKEGKLSADEIANKINSTIGELNIYKEWNLLLENK